MSPKIGVSGGGENWGKNEKALLSLDRTTYNNAFSDSRACPNILTDRGSTMAL
jgi:hypothetical protein